MNLPILCIYSTFSSFFILFHPFSGISGRSKDLEEYAKQLAQEEVADTKARQIRYELYPSKQYVLYLAKKNAIKTWTSDGPDGKNRGCLEVQIAIATEKIRNMILHMREFRKDYRCRLKLTSLVCARRRMLDKLASKNLDSYMKIREELKIRHVYRIEALKNRLGAYMYPIKDRSDLKLTIEGPPPGICCLSS